MVKQIIGKTKPAERNDIVKDKWLLPQIYTKRIKTQSTDGSKTFSIEGDREWLPIRKRSVNSIDSRNGRPCTSLGDKFYKEVEFSPDFFKDGATVSPPMFGARYKYSETFVPISANDTQKVKKRKKEQQLRDDIEAVTELDKWCPANPLKYYRL